MSFATSLSGLANAQTELNVISNNLANADTTGFKSSSVNFANLVAVSNGGDPRTVQGIGSSTSSISQNYSEGSIKQTGVATNLAVNGTGFFTTVSPTGGQTYYTRNGDFTLNSSGYLVDTNGNEVQMLPVSSTGTVTSTTPQAAKVALTDSSGATLTGVTVNSTGQIVASYTDGTSSTAGAVALANFTSPSGLMQVGDQDWQATGLSGTATYNAPGTTGFGTVLSGSLEASNVDVSSQLVGLIDAQQYFQGNSKAISTGNQMVNYIMQATQG